VWSIELGPVLGEEFNDGDHGILLIFHKFAVPGGELIDSADLPSHTVTILIAGVAAKSHSGLHLAAAFRTDFALLDSPSAW
jgi:hypothetical protein